MGNEKAPSDAGRHLGGQQQKRFDAPNYNKNGQSVKSQHTKYNSHNKSDGEVRLILADYHIEFLCQESTRLGQTFSRIIREMLNQYMYASGGNDDATEQNPTD